MARREIGEINAGSMADIAFLLLIFFLVTTTMEVDAGIGRQLPVKNDIQIENPPPVIMRNVLEIFANRNDQLLVEGKFIELDDLYDVVMSFYLDNKNGELNPDMPLYETVSVANCQSEIAKLQLELAAQPENVALSGEIKKWKEKLELCNEIGSFQEMNKAAVVQLKNQAGTSYGLYIEIQNILKKVVNELRTAECKRLDYPEYSTLREDRVEDEVYIQNLRILVPERIIESKIVN